MSLTAHPERSGSEHFLNVRSILLPPLPDPPEDSCYDWEQRHGHHQEDCTGNDEAPRVQSHDGQCADAAGSCNDPGSWCDLNGAF